MTPILIIKVSSSESSVDRGEEIRRDLKFEIADLRWRCYRCEAVGTKTSP
jgi:hypothetical protein